MTTCFDLSSRPSSGRISFFIKSSACSITVSNSFTHLIVCLTTGPKPLPKRALHIVRSRASSFKWEYPLLSLRSSNSFPRLLPCLPVTSIPPCIFPSVTRCRRQFRPKMWAILHANVVIHFCYQCSFTPLCLSDLAFPGPLSLYSEWIVSGSYWLVRFHWLASCLH